MLHFIKNTFEELEKNFFSTFSITEAILLFIVGFGSAFFLKKMLKLLIFVTILTIFFTLIYNFNPINLEDIVIFQKSFLFLKKSFLSIKEYLTLSKAEYLLLLVSFLLGLKFA